MRQILRRLLSNPAALREVVESHGESLLRGMENFAADLSRGGGQLSISQTDLAQFKVGENVATAPGKVVFQNDLFQLLQFDPPSGTDPGAHPTNLRQRGFNHLAFRVDDIEAATANLVANGVTVLSDEMDYISRKLRLFEGPEGITLELVEWVA